MPFNSEEMQKQIRKALEKSKLSEEEVEKVLKDVSKALDKAKASMPKMDMLQPGQFQFPQGAGAFHVGPGGMGGFGDGKALAMHLAHAGGGRLGVSVDSPGPVLVEQLDLPKGRGVVIVGVAKDSAAEKAGLKANDIVLKFANKDVTAEPMAFVKIVEGTPADEEVSAVILRKGKKETIKGITLPEKKKKAEEDQAKTPVTLQGRVIARGAGGDDKPEKSDKGEKKTQRNVSVTINDGKYSAKETEGDLTITVTGKLEDGKVEVTSVVINDGGSKKTYDSLSEVPSKYRARVKKLTDNSGDSPVRFNFRKEGKDDNR